MFEGEKTMSIRLIAMDLDGTLLNSAKVVSKRNMRAIEAAQACGVYVTIATGRMFISAEFFGKRIMANAPIICCNGGMVQAVGADEPVFESHLSEDAFTELMELSEERNWYMQWYIGRDIYADKFRPEYFVSYKSMKDAFVVKEVGKGGWRKYRHNVIQCVARDLDGRIERVTHEIEQRFGGRIRAQQNTGYSVDLTPPEVNKALGISKLADYLGVRQDEVMAMGDGDNDLSMIRWAGTGVAMKNGIDEAKALSDYVAPDNDDDGVGRAIEELVLRA